MDRMKHLTGDEAAQAPRRGHGQRQGQGQGQDHGQGQNQGRGHVQGQDQPDQPHGHGAGPQADSRGRQGQSHPEGDHHGDHYAHDQDEHLPEGPSKSQVKREHHALQDLAQRLVSLPRRELERLELSEPTWVAIEETARIKDIRALGRHYKRIAKLLAKEDMAAVEALLHGRERQKQAEAARLHRLERWRERLITEGDQALGDLLADHPNLDRHQLRTLLRTARKDREQAKTDGDRRLFRFLREALD